MSNPDESPSQEGEEVPFSMSDYCAKLETWLWKAYHQRTLATSAYFTALSSAQQQFQQGQAVNNNYLGQPQAQPFQGARIIFNNVPANQRQPLLMLLTGLRNLNNGNVPGQPQQGQQQGTAATATATVSTAAVARLAPVWKRLLAEVVDFLFLLMVKLFITFTVIDSFELIDLDNIDIDALRAEAAGEGGVGADTPQLQTLYDIAFSLTSELLLLELTHRIVVCFFEAYCLWKAGGTPGKTLLGLRVLHADSVSPFNAQNNNGNNQLLGIDVGGAQVIVRPGCFLSFPRALLRSAVKNFSLAFFFPLCFTMFHFDHSRTLYDLMSHSVVVEM